jgi:uncharacterized protein
MMRLIDEFSIAGDPDRAYALLLDLTRIAPCVPGGEIGEPDADGAYPGRVSVKLGPMKFVYDGKVRIVDRDPEARTARIEGEGRASGGADSAKVSTLMEVLADGDRTRVRMTTELDVKGKAARMGQGVIVDVSRRLVADAAKCIEARLADPDAEVPAASAAQPVGGIGLMASVMGAKVGGSVRRLGGRGDGSDRTKGADDATR